MKFTPEYIIDRCRQASENINNYFSEQRYMTDVEDDEVLTESMLANLAVDRLMDELGVLGLTTSQTNDDLFLSRQSLACVWYLRDFFDKDKLFEYLTNLDDTEYASWLAMFENIPCAEDLLLEISDYMVKAHPTDKRWAVISSECDQWATTVELNNHIQAVIKRVTESTQRDSVHDIQDSDISKVKTLIDLVARQRKEMLLYANKFAELPLSEPVDFERLKMLNSKNNGEMMNEDMISLFANELTNPSEKQPQFIKDYKLHNKAWVNYWEALSETQGTDSKTSNLSVMFTPEHAVMIVFNLALYRKSVEDMLATVRRLEPLLSKQQFSFMCELINLPYLAWRTGDAVN